MNLLIPAFLLVLQTSFYTLVMTSVEGHEISMQSLKGKKVLLVNIATESSWVQQLAQLEQLQQQHKDRLVVIGFPSNSFGKEPLEDVAIRQFCKERYGVTFLLARKAPVTGSEKQALYNWLTHQSENGMMEGEVSGDFQKYLVNEEGVLIGVWGSSVVPTDATLTEMLAQ